MSGEMGAFRAGGVGWAGALDGVECTTDRFQTVQRGFFLMANCVCADRGNLLEVISEVWEVKSVISAFAQNLRAEYAPGAPSDGQNSGLEIQWNACHWQG